MADKVWRLSLTAEGLWAFLKQAVATGNKLQAFGNLNSDLTDSSPYRIWKRFLQAQSAIRTALARLCPPPDVGSKRPEEATIAHLEAAFSDHDSPIAAFQAKLQTFFM